MNHQSYDWARFQALPKHKSDSINAEGFSACVFMEQSFDTSVFLIMLCKSLPMLLRADRASQFTAKNKESEMHLWPPFGRNTHLGNVIIM